MNSVYFCVIGDKEASDVLTSFTNGETMRLLPIHVHQTVTPQCDITYFAVADEGFDNKIKSKINLDNAKRGNYIIGSNLLRIAVMEGN